ncbi:MAG: lytic transglycosylase domain-containing protein [Selenomonadaceae bacterium]|nr:lytic transglycosylase domain-containing protein [Selenomonadaceae bacterium]
MSAHVMGTEMLESDLQLGEEGSRMTRRHRKATSHVSAHDRRMGRRQGICFVLGFLLFLGCFAIYFASQTDYVQKGWLYPYPYRETVERYAHAYGVDSSLAAGVIHAESRFKSTAQSHRGAVGLMQLMPDTAEWIADQVDDPFSLTKLQEPETNIRYGIWYLASLQREFDGNDILALAAYNAGRGNVQEWMKTYGWQQDFCRVEDIPYAETREYVAKVLKYQRKYQTLYAPHSDGFLSASARP